MKLVIDIPEELYAKVPTLLNKGNIWIGDVLEAVKNGTPLTEWLNSFDTSSATECFTAVNLLKQRLEGEDG